jgi:hypothetical protein
MKYRMGTKGHKHVLKLLANVSKWIHARKELRKPATSRLLICYYSKIMLLFVQAM